MESTLRLKHDEAKVQGDRVLELAEIIDKILKTLNEDVNNDIGREGAWSGESANRFKNAWNNCSDNFDVFVNHIKTINEKIELTQQQVKEYEANM